MITIGDKEVTWQKGITLAQVLTAIENHDRYAVVKVDGKLISRPNFAKTIINDHAKIVPLPMIAGG
jgi:thiamine biosynthesis protein ThiS